MNELEIISEMRKGPVKMTGRRMAELGPVKVEQESHCETIIDSPYLEEYRFGAIFGARFVMSQSEQGQTDVRRLKHVALMRTVASHLFSDLWKETYELERLLHEQGWASGYGHEEIFERLSGIREATGRSL